MNLEQPCIRISVRNLVEFILRHGDIDNRTGGADKEAMQQGGRILYLCVCPVVARCH